MSFHFGIDNLKNKSKKEKKEFTLFQLDKYILENLAWQLPTLTYALIYYHRRKSA